MGDRSLVWEYVRSCTAGTSALSDCGPVWQFGVIGALLALATAAFLAMVSVRLHQNSGPSEQ